MRQTTNRVVATMKDVADKAGVSTATVSRAIMAPEKVSAVTLAKVRCAALTVGYSLLPLSRQGKSGETLTLLVMVPDISDAAYGEILRGVHESAAEQGHFILMVSYIPGQADKKSFTELINARLIDGMLLLGADPPFNIGKEEQQNLPPMVMANEFVPEFELPSVHIDNLTAAYEAVDYLFTLGHRRIACISGPESVPLCQYRVEGYIQAMRRHGIANPGHRIFRGQLDYQTGASGLNNLISRQPAPTAIFCHSDVIAFGALSQARQNGMQVPGDVSLVGFGDLNWAQYCDPPLTTVAQPRYQIGREAFRLLVGRVRQPAGRNSSLMLDCKLVVRGSTGLPRTTP